MAAAAGPVPPVRAERGACEVERLSLSSRQQSGWIVLTLRGQLDVGTAPALRQRLQAAQQPGGVRVVLDLEELQFLDSFGIGVLAGGLKRARATGGRLVVARPSERIRGVLDLAGVAQALGSTATLDDAFLPQAGTDGADHPAE